MAANPDVELIAALYDEEIKDQLMSFYKERLENLMLLKLL